MSKRSVVLAVRLGMALGASAVSAQMPNPYSPSINLEQAKAVAAPAIAEMKKNGWTMAVAIVDTGGNLIYFEKIDGTQTGSVALSIAKANSAAMYKRETKTFQDGLAAGGAGLRLLGMSDVVPVEGGVPILADGKIIGAIGVSGGTAQQDHQVASAGAASMK